jgi:DNA-binding CsgD family transcriptional regulator
MLWARALVTEAQGQEDAALRMLTKAWEQCSGAGVVAEYPVISPDLVRMAIAGRERLLAEQVTVAVETLAATAEVASVKGAALRCRGLLDSDPAALLEAVAAYRLSPRKRELALACEDAAVALIAAGRGTDARPLAEEALRAYHSFDACRDVQRALRRLRGIGQGEVAGEEIIRQRTDRSKASSGSGGWESLTRAEVKMADLVAKGLSNPEIARRLFISRRTVQSHVSHALEKLGLSSRVELAVARSSWNARGGGSLPPEKLPPERPSGEKPPPARRPVSDV